MTADNNIKFCMNNKIVHITLISLIHLFKIKYDFSAYANNVFIGISNSDVAAFGVQMVDGFARTRASYSFESTKVLLIRTNDPKFQIKLNLLYRLHK